MFMTKAIHIAREITDEIPVCAIIVKDNKIITTACNKKEQEKNVTSHAEVLAIKQASSVLNNWRLDGCTMYVTLEPCPMCAWAIINSRIDTVYFGSYDMNYGALGSKIDLRRITNSNLKVFGGIYENDCNEILNNYFKKIRHQNYPTE